MMKPSFKKSIVPFKQSVFCGVGAHYQNSVAESNIRMIVAIARNQLLRAKRHWPEAINTIIWPLALKEAVALHNNFQFDSDGRNPVNKLVGTKCLPNTKSFHKCGCPVYVLDNRLQADSKIYKWELRSGNFKIRCSFGDNRPVDRT